MPTAFTPESWPADAPGLESEFELAPGLVYLNHGAYGATPRCVRAAQDRWRSRIEANPTAFFQGEYSALVREAAGAVAGFLGGRAADWVFVENATAGVNAVLASLTLRPGDEILTTTHAYGAVRNVLAHHAGRAGARLVEAALPLPAIDDDAVVAAVAAALNPRTRLAVFDHVTSSTATVLPAARLAALARAVGVPVLIDGAHAPGMLDLDVPAIGADWYVGNAHKWMFAPRGCGLFWTAPDRQAGTHPAVISHGLGRGYAAEFDWIGTRDVTPWLTIADAVAFCHQLGAGRMRAWNRALAIEAAALLAQAWSTEAAAPPAMTGAMASLRLPLPPVADPASAARLRTALRTRFRIEAAVIPFAGELWLRISAQVYNRPEHYRRLAEAVGRLVCDALA